MIAVKGLDFNKEIEHFLFQMSKTSDKERQAKQREKLKQDDRAYQSYLKKDQMRKKLKRVADKKT